MFSNWFAGDARAQYCVSSHKQRMDQVGNNLVQLRYADEVLRQHLHEWLRFSKYLGERSVLLPDGYPRASSSGSKPCSALCKVTA